MRKQKKETHLLAGTEAYPIMMMISEYQNVKIMDHPEYEFIVHHMDGNSEYAVFMISEKSTGMAISNIIGYAVGETIKKGRIYLSNKTKEEIKAAIELAAIIFKRVKENQNLTE